jgi:hypothetical protein
MELFVTQTLAAFLPVAILFLRGMILVDVFGLKLRRRIYLKVILLRALAEPFQILVDVAVQEVLFSLNLMTLIVCIHVQVRQVARLMI